MNALRGRLNLNVARVPGPLSHCSRIFYEPETTRLSLFNSRTTSISSYNTTLYRKFSGTSRIMASSQDTTKWTAPVVRKQFLSFFEKNAHSVGKWRGNSFWWRGVLWGIPTTIFSLNGPVLLLQPWRSSAIVRNVYSSHFSNKMQYHRLLWSLTMIPLSSLRMLVWTSSSRFSSARWARPMIWHSWRERWIHRR